MSFSDEEVERYARHLMLKELGGPGQQRLRAATVALVGAGGIGAPASLYLAAAGAGRLILIDFDDVALSNLQRQILFDTADVGRPKVERAAERLRALNPGVRVETRRERLDPETAARLIEGADVVVDGTDDFATRFAVNDACVRARTPLVAAAVGRWGGQLGVFEGGPCWRCLVPQTPPQAETCAAVGVVGALTGVIGAAAALETIKLATGAGEPLTGRLLVYDGLAAEARVVRVAADPTCPTCGGKSWRSI